MKRYLVTALFAGFLGSCSVHDYPNSWSDFADSGCSLTGVFNNHGEEDDRQNAWLAALFFSYADAGYDKSMAADHVEITTDDRHKLTVRFFDSADQIEIAQSLSTACGTDGLTFSPDLSPATGKEPYVGVDHWSVTLRIAKDGSLIAKRSYVVAGLAMAVVPFAGRETRWIRFPVSHGS